MRFLSILKKNCGKIIYYTIAFVSISFGLMICIAIFSLQKTDYYEKISEIPNDLLPRELTNSFPSKGKVKIVNHTWNSYYEFTGLVKKNADLRKWYLEFKDDGVYEIFPDDRYLDFNPKKDFEIHFFIRSYTKDNELWEIEYLISNMHTVIRKQQFTRERYEDDEIHFTIRYTKPGVKHGR